MNPTPTAAPQLSPIKPRRRRWPRIVLGLLVLLVLGPLGLYVYTAWTTRTAWAEAVAEAERDLPRWRLLEIEEDRPKIPDAENSALHMMAIARKGPRVDVNGAPNYEQIFEKLPPNVQLNEQQIQLIRSRLAPIQARLAEARNLKDMPRGRYPITYTDDFITTLIPDHQQTRMFADLLSHDAFLLAQEKRPDEAVESCQAILNAGRALDGEQMLLGHLIRGAMQRMHTATLERVLAQDTASEHHLQRLQALLDKESKESSMLPAVRGERAGMNLLMENIKNGKLDAAILGDIGGAATNKVGDILNLWMNHAFPSTVLKFYPGFLQFQNRTVEVMKLPIHERIAKFKALESECKGTSNLLIRSFTHAMPRLSQYEARDQAHLRAALAALACERYRLADKDHHWPKSLDALVTAKLLDAVPTDPFDGQPLRFRRTKEGIVVYSVGVDLKDDGGHIDRERMDQLGVDQGFRLWNVDQRRRLPRPPAVLQGPDAP